MDLRKGFNQEVHKNVHFLNGQSDRKKSAVGSILTSFYSFWYQIWSYVFFKEKANLCKSDHFWTNKNLQNHKTHNYGKIFCLSPYGFLHAEGLSGGYFRSI